MDVAAYAAQAAAAKPMPMSSVPSPEPGLVVHVDGDYCAYFCSGNDDTDAGTARRILLNKFEQLQAVSGATSCIVHMTDPSSKKGERYLAATVKPYQGQRKGGRRPRNWALLREFISNYDGDKFRVKNWMEREADDGIAYVSHAAAMSGHRAVIATADKDMRMLPGTHIIWATRQLVHVPFGTFDLTGADGKTYGHKWFWLQMLMGDNADFIPGLPKYRTDSGALAQCGEATAYKLLADVTCNEDAYAVVTGLYRGYYEAEWPDRFVEQATLLWLRTDRHAHLHDFGTIMPIGPKVDAAAHRMSERVAAKRKELEAITCGG